MFTKVWTYLRHLRHKSMKVLCHNAQLKETSRSIVLDTDSQIVGIDNRCSACLIHKITDFTGPLHDTKKVIAGYGGVRDTNIKRAK